MPVDTFRVVGLNLRDPPIEIGKIVVDYVTQVLVANAYLTFEGPSLIFYGKKSQYFQLTA